MGESTLPAQRSPLQGASRAGGAETRDTRRRGPCWVGIFVNVEDLPTSCTWRVTSNWLLQDTEPQPCWCRWRPGGSRWGRGCRREAETGAGEPLPLTRLAFS